MSWEVLRRSRGAGWDQNSEILIRDLVFRSIAFAGRNMVWHHRAKKPETGNRKDITIHRLGSRRELCQIIFGPDEDVGKLEFWDQWDRLELWDRIRPFGPVWMPLASAVGRNGPQWSAMVRNGPQWSAMVRNGPQWSAMVRNGPQWRASPWKQSARHRVSAVPGLYLATTYSHRTYRPTTIGAAAFHFRVRNGTGWFHRAVVTRVQCWDRAGRGLRFQYCLSGDIELSPLCLSRPLFGIRTEIVGFSLFPPVRPAW